MPKYAASEMKIVLDTNVLVSGLISKGYPAKILTAVLKSSKIKLCLSDPVIEEYQAVLARPKFSRFPSFIENAAIVLHHLQSQSLWFTPKTPVNLLFDQSDNKFLELAFEAKANFLVTGNTQDFTFKQFRNTEIISPKDFYDIALTQKP